VVEVSIYLGVAMIADNPPIYASEQLADRARPVLDWKRED
jgi:hypothetical protein